MREKNVDYFKRRNKKGIKEQRVDGTNINK